MREKKGFEELIDGVFLGKKTRLIYKRFYNFIGKEDIKMKIKIKKVM